MLDELENPDILVSRHFSKGLVQFVRDGFELFLLVNQFILGQVYKCPFHFVTSLCTKVKLREKFVISLQLKSHPVFTAFSSILRAPLEVITREELLLFISALHVLNVLESRFHFLFHFLVLLLGTQQIILQSVNFLLKFLDRSFGKLCPRLSLLALGSERSQLL